MPFAGLSVLQNKRQCPRCIAQLVVVLAMIDCDTWNVFGDPTTQWKSLSR